MSASTTQYPAAPAIDRTSRATIAQTFFERMRHHTVHGRHPVYTTLAEDIFEEWFLIPIDTSELLPVLEICWTQPEWAGIASMLNTVMRQEKEDGRTEFTPYLPTNRAEFDQFCTAS